MTKKELAEFIGSVPDDAEILIQISPVMEPESPDGIDFRQFVGNNQIIFRMYGENILKQEGDV